MVRQKIARLLIAVLVLITLMQISTTVHASQVESVSSRGITVSPAIEYIKLKQKQTIASFITTVTNSTDSPIVITPSARDFTASSDGRKLTFIKPDDSSEDLHGLSDELKVTLSNPVLGPGKSVKIPVIINNADSLAPGGHYAAVIYEVRSLNSENKNIVSVNEAVSCLVFLNTFSGGTQVTKVAAFPVSGFMTSLPQSADVVLANTGNTQTIPRGYVQVTGPGGNTVAQGVINVDSGMILPDSKRLFPVSLSSHGNHSLFGVYHEKLFYRHDGQDHYNVNDQKFFYINVFLCLIAVFVLVVLGFCVYFIIKYSRHLIKRRPKKTKPQSHAPAKPKPQKFMDIK